MLFYAVVAIILGVILIGFAVKISLDKSLKAIPFYIISLMYIGVGIYGFFINQDLYYIIIICLIVICVIALATFSLLYKKPREISKK